MRTRHYWMGVTVLSLLGLAIGCAGLNGGKEDGWRALLTEEELPNWRLTPWRPNVKPWTLKDGIYQGTCAAGWVGHADVFEDFILEGDIFFDGVGGGAIVFRGNRDVKKTWESGYSLSIGPSEVKGRSCMSFAVFPKGLADRKLYFEPDKWHSIRAEVRGSQITVTLSEAEALHISDPKKQFVRGQICLEDLPCQKGDPCRGEGHVKYRNLRVRPL